MTYSRDDGASQEIVDQRELVDMMLRLAQRRRQRLQSLPARTH